MTAFAPPEGVAVIPLPTPFLVPDINVFVIKQDPPILIDAGPNTAEAYDKLAAGLQKAGYAFSDIGAVVLTHEHIDHSGLLAQVMAESGAEAYAHPAARLHLAEYDERAETGIATFEEMLRTFGATAEASEASIDDWRDDRQYGAPADIRHTIADGAALFGYTAHYVPGHSASDILLVAEDGGHSITGDHLLKTINPNPLLRIPPPGETRARSLVELRQSLNETARRELGLALPGHGEFIRDHRGIIARLQARYDRKGADVLSLLRERPRTPFEVSKTMFPKLEDKHLFLGLSVALGHLEMLEDEGRAACTMRDGVLVYGAV